MNSRRDLLKAGAMAGVFDRCKIKVTPDMVGAAVDLRALAKEIVQRGHEASGHGQTWTTVFHERGKLIVRGRSVGQICVRVCFAVWLGCGLLVSPAGAQQRSPTSNDQYPENPTAQESAPSRSKMIERLPIEWIIGPYVPVQEQLEPLTNSERGQIYLRQTFLTAGSYVARAFSSGIDQARGEPHEWGGGFAGYGKRNVARYGQFVVQNSILSGGNALLGFEPRYDFCRCEGFWPRTRHAMARNFVTYNRTEQELRPQVPMYVGAFSAGVLYSKWLPGQHNIWTGGTYNVLSQAGIGSGYNFVSEFALDILHAFGLAKSVTRGYDRGSSSHLRANRFALGNDRTAFGGRHGS